MSSVLLSISGHDRAGIVRDVAESLLHLNANIEDSSMTALRGRFTMMMIVSLPEDRSLGELKAALGELERRTRLSVQSQVISDAEANASAIQPDHVITVHGADRVGIVHGVTAALADAGASIVDVSTEQREGEDGSVYMMVLEVAAGGQEGLNEALQAVAERMGVTVEVHSLDDAIL